MSPEKRNGSDRRRGRERRSQFERRERVDPTRNSTRRNGVDRRRYRDRRGESNCGLCGLWAEPLIRCPKCGACVCPTCTRVAWAEVARRNGGWAVREILLICSACGSRMPEDLRHHARATKGRLAEWLGVTRYTLRKLIAVGCCTAASG
jgi:hypothetical protein